MGSEEDRRIILLNTISLFGIIFIVIFAIIAWAQKNNFIFICDLVTAILLFLNLVDSRLRKNYQFNIWLGIIFVSGFYILIYITGGINNTAFLWYLTYPLIASYLLGSNKGGIASVIMIVPVLTFNLITPENSIFARYDINLTVRFIGAYCIIGIFSYLFENTREKNRDELKAINQSLEEIAQKRAKALTESELLLTEMTRQVPGVFYQFYAKPDGEAGLYFVSERVESVIGIKNDIDGFFERFTDLIVPEHKKSFMESIEKAIKEKSEWNYEGQLQKPTGEIIWFHGNSMPLEREEEIIFNGFVQDITEKKLANIELKESEKKYKNLVELAQEGIWVIDENHKTSFVNTSMARMLGYTPDEMLGKPLFYFMDERGKYIADRNIERRKHGIKEQHDFEFIKKDGHRLYSTITTSAIIDDEGNYKGAIAGVIDITERKKSEEALRESEERFRTLFENAPLPYQSLDDDGHFIEVNETWLETLGYQKSDVIGKSFADFLHPDWVNHFRENFPKFKSIGETLGVEFDLKHKDGSYVRVSFDGKIRRDEKGNFIQTYCVFNNITEKRKIEKILREKEDALRQAQKMESVGNLAGGIAHDFNNILGIILGNNELLSDEIPEYSPLNEHIEEIRIASLRARDVVRQLMTFSRMGDEKLEPVDIAEVIKESVKLIRSTIPANIDLNLNISDDVKNIYGNPTQINQVLINLCSNAKDALSSLNPSISIELTNTSLNNEDALKHPNLNPGDYIKLLVSDNGCGMDENIIDKIFDPYFTTKEVGKGSGIGLAVTHGIIERHNGAIFVESKLNAGTTVTILLPAFDIKLEDKAFNSNELPTGKERILFIDDEDSIVKMVKEQFNKLGYTVDAFTDPVEAVNYFKENPVQFDLIITDMAMPKMTGDSVASEILSIRSDIPIILCTGYSENISEAELLKRGIRKFIMKPFDRFHITKTIREVLDNLKT